MKNIFNIIHAKFGANARKMPARGLKHNRPSQHMPISTLMNRQLTREFADQEEKDSAVLVVLADREDSVVAVVEALEGQVDLDKVGLVDDRSSDPNWRSYAY